MRVPGGPVKLLPRVARGKSYPQAPLAQSLKQETKPVTTDLEIRRRRALYRAEHRGTKEMDLVLGPYAKAKLATMGEEELAAFEGLLLEPDPELQEMMLGGRPPEPRLADLIHAIRTFHGLKAH